jgi:hypothetical protein
VASVATLGAGGALGFEGPSIYIGSVIGTGLQTRFRRLFLLTDVKVLMVAGAAAGVAAGTECSLSSLSVKIVAADRVVGVVILESFEREHAFGAAPFVPVGDPVTHFQPPLAAQFHRSFRHFYGAAGKPLVKEGIFFGYPVNGE